MNTNKWNDYNNPPQIDWDHLPPFVQDGEEEIRFWSLPLEAWDPDCRVWYWTEKNGRHGLNGFNGREQYVEPRQGFHPAPRVRASALDQNAPQFKNSFFFVWEKDR